MGWQCDSKIKIPKIYLDVSPRNITQYHENLFAVFHFVLEVSGLTISCHLVIFF